MKFLQRLSCVLLVCVIFVGLFSTTALADEVEVDIVTRFNGRIYPNNNYTDYTTLINSDGNVDNGNTLVKGNTNSSLKINTYTRFLSQYVITEKSNGILFKKGEEVTVKIENLYTHMKLGNITCYLNLTDRVSFWCKFADGSSGNTNSNFKEEFEYNTTKKAHGYEFTFTPTKDIVEIHIEEWFTPYELWGYSGTYSVEYAMGVDSWKITANTPDKKEGLLSGLLEWIKNLYTKTVNGFDNMVKGITELPQKIWSFIEDGLKNLFVPDEEYMTGYSDSWDELLSQRFGAIYQVSNIIVDFVERIQVADETNTIYMPSVNLSSTGIPFSFGGYNIQIVPDGFNTLVEVCKKILSIACTFLFINSLRKRYDEVMGVEQ